MARTEIQIIPVKYLYRYLQVKDQEEDGQHRALETSHPIKSKSELSAKMT